MKVHVTTDGGSEKCWVGVCGQLPKTLTLFMTKICDFCYPIYGRCSWHSCPNHNLWKAFVYGLTNNDAKVASSMKHIKLTTKSVKTIPYLWPNGRKTMPIESAHTCTAHIKEYHPPPPPGWDLPLLSCLNSLHHNLGGLWSTLCSARNFIGMATLTK